MLRCDADFDGRTLPYCLIFTEVADIEALEEFVRILRLAEALRPP